MDIFFRAKKLEKQCNSLKEAQRKWGADCGKLLLRRLDELKDSENLAVFRLVHRRCHKLTGNRAGEWSADLRHPLRLLFRPTCDPVPMLEDGSIDEEEVTAVEILEVTDTHG